MELPSLEAREELVRRYARVLDSFGAEVGDRPLVKQTAEFFPDAFERDEASLRRLVKRLSTHAGLDDIPIEVGLSSGETPPGGGGGCGSGGCAAPQPNAQALGHRLEETPEGWRINIAPSELGHPGALACILATALGRIFLEETVNPQCPVQAPVEATTELVCVSLGLGLLLLEGSYIYSKSCGGPSVAQVTHLSVGQLAVACALFIQNGNYSERHARSSLGTTQKAVLTEAFAWTQSNARKLEGLRNNPSELTEGPLGLTVARSWLSRVLDREADPSSPENISQALGLDLGLSEAEMSSLATATKARAPRAPDPERDELSALVDEALRSS